jgi:hypothetical protein
MIMPEVEGLDGTELFSDNYAGIYGNNIASYSQKIVKLSQEEYEAATTKYALGDSLDTSVDASSLNKTMVSEAKSTDGSRRLQAVEGDTNTQIES